MKFLGEEVDGDTWQRMLSLPHVVSSLQDIANKKNRLSTKEEKEAYLNGVACGLYHRGPIDDGDGDCGGDDALLWETRKLAVTTSCSVVGLRCPSSGYRDFFSSGIVVASEGISKILTSAYLLDGRSWSEAVSLSVDVYLPNRKTVKGFLVYLDHHHNLAIFSGELSGVKNATFDTKLLDLGCSVTALGRGTSYKLKAYTGRINIRRHQLDSDVLMSSSCRFSEWGIGGPLIDNSSGKVIGMNFFNVKCSPFIPSTILLKCLKQFANSRSIKCPWLGLKARSLNEVNIDELELIFLEIGSMSGLFVKEVKEGSPAHKAGICVGDVIVSCNGTPISSPIQLADLLFKMVESDHGATSSAVKRLAMSVEVVVRKRSSTVTEDRSIRIESLTPPVIHRWPVLPLASATRVMSSW